jgi:hypothetical protein
MIFRIVSVISIILNMENIHCECGNVANLLTVKKEGKNTGREFYTCATRTCNFFGWNDSRDYNSDKFKSGTCSKCGYFSCDDEKCDRVFDFYHNKIPSD